MKTGVDLIKEERQRQIEVEGYSLDHDRQYYHGELCLAAVTYILNITVKIVVEMYWPWDMKWWKPTTPVRDLQKAGALIAAELDRLLAEKREDLG